MSDNLQPPRVSATSPTPVPLPLLREQPPDPGGVGRAQRSEPERSDGERSGARPTPPDAPATAPHTPARSHVDGHRAEYPSSHPHSAPPPGPASAEDLTQATTSAAEDHPADAVAWGQRLRLAGRARGRRLVPKDAGAKPTFTAQQRLLLLDTWQRSGLPANDFAALVGVSKHTLYAWKKAFDTQGPAGLMDQPRGGPRGSRLPELTKRTILMLKQANPDWGCQRISDMLLRGPALPVSATAVARVLHEAGYQMEEVTTRPHPDQVRFFERAQPNQLWQTDLFTFVLKRQNRRVYLVAFLDDHSRFLVSYGLHASQSSALVLEVLRAGITSYGTPAEILTDNGAQYVTWRGKSAFTKELEKRGIRQVVAAPRRPQTLGKIERFWGTLWRECLASAVFVDLGDAQRRIGWFMDHYNFQRCHQGIEGLTPADRFFGAAPEVKRTLQARVAANALELARQGQPKAPFYLTGQVGGQPFSVHAEGERVILTRAEGERQEIDLVPPQPATPAPSTGPVPLCPLGEVVGQGTEAAQAEPPPPGVSPLDEGWPQCSAAGLPREGGDA